MRRRSWARTTKTNRIRQVSVGTEKKSMATVEPRLRRGAMVDSQLLAQRQVLEHETAMSARQDDQEPSDLDDTDDHGPA